MKHQSRNMEAARSDLYERPKGSKQENKSRTTGMGQALVLESALSNCSQVLEAIALVMYKSH